MSSTSPTARQTGESALTLFLMYASYLFPDSPFMTGLCQSFVQLCVSRCVTFMRQMCHLSVMYHPYIIWWRRLTESRMSKHLCSSSHGAESSQQKQKFRNKKPKQIKIFLLQAKLLPVFHPRAHTPTPCEKKNLGEASGDRLVFSMSPSRIHAAQHDKGSN